MSEQTVKLGELPELFVTCYIGVDGRLVVEIATPEWPDTIDTGPDLRVYMNDGLVYGTGLMEGY